MKPLVSLPQSYILHEILDYLWTYYVVVLRNLSFHSSEDYVSDLAKRLEIIHCGVKEQMEEKSLKLKAWYDQKIRQIQFREGQKV